MIQWFAWPALGAAGLATLFAQFAGRHWVLELFSHFRVTYLLMLVFAGLSFLYVQNLPAAAAALLLAIPNFVYVGPYLPGLLARTGPPENPQADSASFISVISLNLLFENHAHDRVRTYLERKSPDLIVLSELTPAWARALAGFEQAYQWHEVHPKQGPFGLAVYSRYPLSDTQITGLGAPDSVNVHTLVDLPDRQLELFAVHLSAPTTAERAMWRNSQLENLSQQLGGQQDIPNTSRPDSPDRTGAEKTDHQVKMRQKMIIGDLNLTPFSACFARLLRSTGLIDARRRSGLHVTWPIGWIPLWIPIDHCIVGPDASSVHVQCGPDVGSDHYPLEVSISIRS